MTRPWVLITGASAGIGRELALVFASHHYNVVAVSRDKAKLDDVCAECRLCGVEAEAYSCDLSTEQGVNALCALIKTNKKEISVLVNNAGFGVHGVFSESPLERELEMVRLQASATLTLCKELLPAMLKRREGGILNIASVYSFSPVPQQSVYAAVKSFLLSYSLALREELRETGVTVTTVCPGVTQSEFRVRAGMGDKKSGMSAHDVAQFSYQAFKKKKAVAVPGLVNKIFWMLSRLLSAPQMTALVRKINQRRGLSQKALSSTD